MANRADLHSLLCTTLGTNHVYFQPPASVQMVYPAIVYSLSSMRNTFANDSVYKQNKAYQVIIIDKNPDSLIPDKVSKLTLCSFDRYYVSDNLNHYVFTIYY